MIELNEVRELASYVDDWRDIVFGHTFEYQFADLVDRWLSYVSDVWDLCEASDDQLLQIVRAIRQSEQGMSKKSCLLLVYAVKEPS